jgi:signal transduction histidine kinase/FixJ family two-component response regulator
MRAALKDRSWDLVISDYVLPEFSGLAALDILKESGLDLPFIIVSGNINEDMAVAAMKAGAHDYVMKDNLARLVPAVERELREAAVRSSRRAAQEALEKATDLLEKIFAITHVRVAYLDANFNFLRVNHAFAQADRREPPFFPGKNYFTLYPDKETEAIFRRVVETGDPFFFHAKPLTAPGNPDGAPVFCDLSLQPVTGPYGKVDGIILSLTDITKEVKLEQHLRHSQKMEALGTLAGGIAHDFNNILTAIVVNTELSLDDAERSGHYLSSVLEAAGRGRDLVKQVLAFSRKTEQVLGPTRLSPVIREALGFLRASVPSTIEIRARIAEKPDVAMVDATQVHQVLMNLGSNAAHAMRERGGIMEITLSGVAVDSELASQEPGLKPGPYLKLSVRDTGPGIPPEVLPRIFDPFFTTKKPEEGTGMGLAMVHGIVKSWRGAITVDTEPGKGTTFSVFLPRVLKGAKRGRAAPGAIPGGDERILVVDDEGTQAQALGSMLERLGYRIVTETNSALALDIFRRDPAAFDLVVTDQVMPRLTGSELAQAVLRLRPGIPVILCTGFSDLMDEYTAKSLGIRVFIMKPYSAREMAAAVREALGTKA